MENLSWCHSCNSRPPNGAVECSDGEFSCSACGKVGYIEFGLEAPEDAGNQSSFLRRRSLSVGLDVTPSVISDQPRVLPLTLEPMAMPIVVPLQGSSINTTTVEGPSLNRSPVRPQRDPISDQTISTVTTTTMTVSINSSRSPAIFTHQTSSPAVRAMDGNRSMNHQPFQNPMADVAFLTQLVAPLQRTFEEFMAQNAVLSNESGSAPTSSAFIASLPDETLTAETAVGDCAICQEDFSVGDVVKRLSPNSEVCAHAFHPECVLPWLNTHNTCPVCRYELPSDDAETERRRRERAIPSTANTVADGVRAPSQSPFPDRLRPLGQVLLVSGVQIPTSSEPPNVTTNNSWHPPRPEEDQTHEESHQSAEQRPAAAPRRRSFLRFLAPRFWQ